MTTLPYPLQGESLVMSKLKYLATTVCVLLLTTVSWAQSSYPKYEVPVDFSFVNVHPDLPVITSFNVFGGGLGGVWNFTPLIGIKADFQFYTQGSGVRTKLTNAGYKTGQVSANFVTYMFGPQFKYHKGRYQ